MSRIALVHQHTNNFGDDAAGSALVESIFRIVSPDELEVSYIWDRGSGGLPTAGLPVAHHRVRMLSGTRDRRPQLALLTLLSLISPLLVRGEMRQFVRRAAQADHVFVAPAGSNIGIYKDWMYLLSLALLIRGGVTPIFCQNTVAESNSWAFDRVARYVLRRSKIYVRESRSQAYVTKLGVPSVLGVDSALMLALESPAEAITSSITIVPTRLSNWHRDHREFDDMEFILDVLAPSVAAVATESDLDVRVLSHLYGIEQETQMLEHLRARLEELGCRTTVVCPTDFRGYARALQTTSCVVSMRYHGLILSGQAGTPCVTVSYENKMNEAARYMRQESRLRQVETVETAELSGLIRDALAISDSDRDDLKALSATLRDVATKPVRDLVGDFLAPARR